MNRYKLFKIIVVVNLLLLNSLVNLVGLAKAAVVPSGEMTKLSVTKLTTDLENISPAQTTLTSKPGLFLPLAIPPQRPLLNNTAALTITKIAESDPVTAGEALTYTIVISNGGQEDNTDAIISDTLPANTEFVPDSITLDPPGAGTIGTDPPTLASAVTISAGQSVTVTYAVTVSTPLTNGTIITNTASVTSTQVPTPTISTITSSVTATPIVKVVKQGPTTANVGDTVIFSFTVTNEGNTLLQNVEVKDDYAGTATLASGDNGDGWLDLTEAWLYTASYTIPPTTTDPLVNTATVTASDVLNTQTTDTDSHSTDIEFDPALSIVKSGPIGAKVGDPVTYVFNITNDTSQGDGSPISNVMVSDNIAGPATLLFKSGGDTDDLLEVDETWAYIATYIVKAIDPNLLTNTATVTGQDGDSEPISDTDTHTVDIRFEPILTMTKNGPAIANVGQTVVYTFTVNHTGTSDGSPVNNVSVADDVAGPANYVSGDDGNSLLEIGETWTYTASYTVPPTTTDPLTNTGTVTSKDKDDDDITANASHSTMIEYAPVLDITKNGPTTVNLNQKAVFTFTVSHAGTSDGSPISNVSVTDNIAGPASYVIGDDGDSLLEFGETWTYTASYIIQLTDPDPLENTGTVEGKDKDDENITANASHSTAIEYLPVLTITKSGPATANVGQTVSYTFTVTHAGTSDGSPVSDVSVTDSIASPVNYVGGDDTDSLLELGETWTYTASYIIQLTDPDPLLNTGTVEGKDKDDENITANASHSTMIEFAPVLTITKDGPITVTAGSPINYTLTVTNSGQATAYNLVITDAIPTGATYLSGGTKIGNTVEWVVASLAPSSTTQVTFAVNASAAITNSDYIVSADGGVSAVGQKVVTTEVMAPAPSSSMVYLPIIFKPEPTILYIQNATSGVVTVIVRNLGGTEVTRCTVSSGATVPCDHDGDGSNVFPPGTYNHQITQSPCGTGTFPKTYPSGPQVTKVVCN